MDEKHSRRTKIALGAIDPNTSNAGTFPQPFEHDEGTLREAISAYGDAVYGMAHRIVAEPMLAEEVTQDTFLALWRQPAAYDPARGSLKAFLLGVARNKGVDLVRREEALRRMKESLGREAETEVTPTSAVEGLEQRLEMCDALAQLSSAQREAIVLAYFGGRTYREMAKELGIPEGTAKTRVRDGLAKLGSLINWSKGGAEV